ncbi:MAG TPA: hypothetical protein VKA16_01320, partial [Burkholderiales bacterium]|nr:hypothetical protein [Burkholderiales bacterium]
GAGDKFFCIGGRKEGMEDTLLYAGVLPTLEMYESIDRLPAPFLLLEGHDEAEVRAAAARLATALGAPGAARLLRLILARGA